MQPLKVGCGHSQPASCCPWPQDHFCSKGRRVKLHELEFCASSHSQCHTLSLRQEKAVVLITIPRIACMAPKKMNVTQNIPSFPSPSAIRGHHNLSTLVCLCVVHQQFQRFPLAGFHQGKEILGLQRVWPHESGLHLCVNAFIELKENREREISRLVTLGQLPQWSQCEQ